MNFLEQGYTNFNEQNMFTGLPYCADFGARMTIQHVAKNRTIDNHVLYLSQEEKGIMLGSSDIGHRSRKSHLAGLTKGLQLCVFAQSTKEKRHRT